MYPTICLPPTLENGWVGYLRDKRQETRDKGEEELVVALGLWPVNQRSRVKREKGLRNLRVRAIA